MVTLAESERGTVFLDEEQNLIFIEFTFGDNEKPNAILMLSDDFGEYSRLIAYAGMYFHCPSCLKDIADDMYNFADDVEKETKEEDGE